MNKCLVCQKKRAKGKIVCAVCRRLHKILDVDIEYLIETEAMKALRWENARLQKKMETWVDTTNNNQVLKELDEVKFHLDVADKIIRQYQHFHTIYKDDLEPLTRNYSIKHEPRPI